MLETQKKPALTGRTKRGPVDGTLAVILLLLLLTGLLVLFSATYYTAQDQGDPLGEVKKQLLGIGLGTVAMLVTSRIPYRFWQDTWVIVGGPGAKRGAAGAGDYSGRGSVPERLQTMAFPGRN